MRTSVSAPFVQAVLLNTLAKVTTHTQKKEPLNEDLNFVVHYFVKCHFSNDVILVNSHQPCHAIHGPFHAKMKHPRKYLLPSERLFRVGHSFEWRRLRDLRLLGRLGSLTTTVHVRPVSLSLEKVLTVRKRQTVWRKQTVWHTGRWFSIKGDSGEIYSIGNNICLFKKGVRWCTGEKRSCNSWFHQLLPPLLPVQNVIDFLVNFSLLWEDIQCSVGLKLSS